MTEPLNPHHAVYAGSFDPLTLGHLDIIERAARLFERVTVAIGINPEKRTLFTPDERLTLIQHSITELSNVDVQTFRGLTVEFIRQCGAAVLVRGMRTLSDIETEFTLTLANRALAPEVETVFLMASNKYTHVSSSLIKQVAQLSSSDTVEQLRSFVPPAIITPLLQKLRPGAF
ncbi:MAG: Phosphopantetheine adenylyltransferase [Planctomycetaceae bacterium]|nr:Phosphopantetheine adenylyltransferase [Planctomycetaceae bacterium]